jgi:putative NADPH-quinone reductase
MQTKRIFIIDGHPAGASLSRAFAEKYAAEARNAGHQVRLIHLHDLEFDSDFGVSQFRDAKPLEPVLERIFEHIEWCEHFVLAAPMWWGGLPAKLKGLIDRVLLPGRAFDTRVKQGTMPKPMLGGRSARVILTSDTPGWVMRFIYKNALIWQLRRQVLGFIGIRPSRFTWFSGASHPGDGLVERWMAKVGKIGAAAA